MTHARGPAACVALGAIALALACVPGQDDAERRPVSPPPRLPVAVATEPVTHDADDPAIWISREQPASSLILGTDKSAAPGGALVVFGLDGRVRQRIGPLDRPNNVDVEYGLIVGGAALDVAVVTERNRSRLRVYAISARGGQMTEVSDPTRTMVFAGESGERAWPMGIGLYKRPADGTVFAIVSRKTGPAEGYLWQYRLEDDGAGRVRAVKARELGAVAPGPETEVEAVVVDDARGIVYYAEEGRGIHAWRADPDAADAGREVALFGGEGFRGDREGLAVYVRPDGERLLVACDQIPGGSRYLVYDVGALGTGAGQPEPRLVATIEGGADDTDGIEVVAESLGPRFPHGLLVAMSSSSRNFLVYRWEDLGLDVD